MIGHSVEGVNEASENAKNNKGQMQGERKMKESSCVQMNQRIHGQEGAGCRRKQRMARCTSLNGSTWSSEKKNMRRYKGTFDVFFGVERRI